MTGKSYPAKLDQFSGLGRKQSHGFFNEDRNTRFQVPVSKVVVLCGIGSDNYAITLNPELLDLLPVDLGPPSCADYANG